MRRISLILAVLVWSTSYAKQRQEKPNFIIIFTDDQGYQDLGCFGSSSIKTLHIDKMAEEGVKLTNFYVVASLCTPSRAALMTGSYPARVNLATGDGFPVLLAGDRKGLNPKEITIAEVLKSRGYKTEMFGKWHLGMGVDKPDYNSELKPGPLVQGFDYFFGVPMVNSGPPFVYVENHSVVGYSPNDPFVLGKKAARQQWPEKSGYKAIGGV